MAGGVLMQALIPFFNFLFVTVWQLWDQREANNGTKFLPKHRYRNLNRDLCYLPEALPGLDPHST